MNFSFGTLQRRFSFVNVPTFDTWVLDLFQVWTFANYLFKKNTFGLYFVLIYSLDSDGGEVNKTKA